MWVLSSIKRRRKMSQERSQGWKWDRCDCLNKRRKPEQYIDKDGILKCGNCKVYICGGY